MSNLTVLPSVRHLFPHYFPNARAPLIHSGGFTFVEGTSRSPSPAPSSSRLSSVYARSDSPSSQSGSSATSIRVIGVPNSSPAMFGSFSIQQPQGSSDAKPQRIRRKYIPPRKYACDVCNARFARPCELRSHGNKHTGERPWNCPLCDRSFSTSSNVSRHMKTLHVGHHWEGAYTSTHASSHGENTHPRSRAVSNCLSV
ncbi:hypothetical protein BKA62DRAFT_354543 [Auriculariales sp. MPI-PUGE-AT-0066]|nr:hypothetical protein BKA62DRAFT_354543 [Auriculariales sp. MPI-PUGE-AT-0066]